MEPTNNKRLFIAVAVSMAILLVWQLFVFEPPAPKEAEPDDAQDSAETVETSPDTSAKPGEASPGASPTDAPAMRPAEAVVPIAEATLATDFYELTLTSVGARALAYVLKQPDRYADHPSFLSPLFDGVDEGADLAGISLPLNTVLKGVGLNAHSRFVVLPVGDDAGVAMRWVSDDGTIEVDKRFQPGESDYAIDLVVTVRNKRSTAFSDEVSLELYNRQRQGDEPGFFGPGRPVEAACLTDEDVERASPGDEAETFDAAVSWIAITEQYFVTLASPDDAASCRIEGFENGLLQASIASSVTVPPQDSVSVEYELYFGPKESAPLDAFGHGAYRTVDYGWFEFIARPIAWLLFKLEGLFGNWGLAIIFLTILIRGLLWPVTQRSQESMMRMRDVSPQLKEIQAKYKNEPTVLQQKQMELFRQHNVSPFGCLPLLLQIPIWFALYRTIYVTAELYRADFALWLNDLSAPDPYYILPLIAGGLFFLQQKLTPTTITDVRQKVMMTVFPLVFVVVMLFLPSGLNLYILVSSLIGVAQAVYTQKKKRTGKGTDATGDADGPREPQTAAERRAAKRRQRATE